MFEHDTPETTTCNAQSLSGALPCDAWHHYYHYQSSAQYLWLAETLRALGRSEEARKAYERAVFQDHFNEEALEGMKDATRTACRAPLYDKHPVFDHEFRRLIGEQPNEAAKLHDEGAAVLERGKVADALAKLDEAIAAAPHHSNSWFTRGRCYFLEGRLEPALADFMEAIRLSHQSHDAYHRAASLDHLERARGYLRQGALDLAVSDFTKALDLFRGNKEALKERAQAYRAKGNIKLAEEDEARL